MSVDLSGQAKCDSCGVGLGRGSLAEAVVAAYMTGTGEAVTVHWCLAVCGPNVLAANTAHLDPAITGQGVFSPPAVADA